jgi:predicted  nucleic acid-binding Zn-ribbon protein
MPPVTGSNPTVLCANCGRELTEPVESTKEAREPCPNCGSEARKFHVELTSTIQATSSVTATLSNTRAESQVSPVGTAHERETAHPATPTRDEIDKVDPADLPTEVIAEAIDAGINLLPPPPGDPNGQWVAEVGAWGHYVPLGVGDIDDILFAAVEWLSGLADRFQKKRGPAPPED